MRHTKRSKIWIETGAVLIIASLLLTLINIRQNVNANWESNHILHELNQTVYTADQNDNEIASGFSNSDENTEKTEKTVFDPDLPMPETDLNGDKYIGTLEIPILDLLLPVLSEYDDLKVQRAPCRYSGSVYTNDMVLSAHNYSYHFGRINSLNTGDFAVFTDIKGNVFEYCLTEIDTLKNTDVEKMITGDDWDLTLFTCTIGGANRVAARFKLVSLMQY